MKQALRSLLVPSRIVFRSALAGPSYSTTAANSTAPRAARVLRFWLGEEYGQAPQNCTADARKEIWYKGGQEVDEECKSLFEGDLHKASSGELDSWDKGYNGLAAVILMDQISRNVYRDTPKAFALDEKALGLSKAIHDGSSTARFPPVHRLWLYMPLMHSERLEDLQLCIHRFEVLSEEARQIPDADSLVKDLETNVSFAKAHSAMIESYGRYPHRNKVLGRQNTPEEVQGFADGSISIFS